jgi:hypothetical protein
MTVIVYSSAGGIQPPICCTRENIAYTPVVGDLAILFAHYIDGLEVNLAVSCSVSKRWRIEPVQAPEATGGQP